MTSVELFDAYLEGKSNPEEKQAFEQRLREDADLAREFELYRTMNADMQEWQQHEAGRTELKQTLKRITGQEKAKVIPLRWYLWRAAALVVLVLAVWKVTSIISSGDNDKKLYKEYIAAAGNHIITRGAADRDSLWGTVAAYIRKKKFAEAVAPLKQIIANGNDSAQEASVYLGYCYLHTGKDNEAETIFNNANNAPGENGDLARLYRALLYLKTNRKEQSVKLLDSIAVSGGTSHKRLAKELSAKLK